MHAAEIYENNMALDKRLIQTTRNAFILITMMTARTAVSHKIQITISNVQNKMPCPNDCWPLYYTVCVALQPNHSNCITSGDNCTDTTHCTDMKMPNDSYPSLRLLDQSFQSETDIKIYIVKKMVFDSNCGRVVTRDCRTMTTTYPVDNANFTFQVTLSDVPDTTSTVTTSQQTATSSTSQATSVTSSGPDSTIHHVTGLSTSSRVTLHTDVFASNDQTTVQSALSTTSSPKHKVNDTEGGLLVGGIAGGIAFIVFIMITVWCCWKNKNRKKSVSPGNDEEKVENSEETEQIDQEATSHPDIAATENEIFGLPTNLAFPVIPSLPPEKTFITGPGHSMAENDGALGNTSSKRLPHLTPSNEPDEKQKKKKKKRKKKKKKDDTQSQPNPEQYQNGTQDDTVIDVERRERKRKRKEERERKRMEQEESTSNPNPQNEQ